MRSRFASLTLASLLYAQGILGLAAVVTVIVKHRPEAAQTTEQASGAPVMVAAISRDIRVSH